jgi:hypothetical protein
MSKKILVISASLRNGSNSDMLADEFMRGALESGNKAEKITLRGKSINFCKGCLACQKTGKCVINDDMAEILPKMQQADVICFASPVYFYDMCGQLKTFLPIRFFRRNIILRIFTFYLLLPILNRLLPKGRLKVCRDGLTALKMQA